LELKEAATKSPRARYDRDEATGVSTPQEADKFRRDLEAGFLIFKTDNLKQQLAAVKGNAEEEKAVRQEIALFNQDVERQGYEAAIKAAENRERWAKELLDFQRATAESEREIIDFRKEQQRKVLDNTVDSTRGQARIDALVVLREFDLDSFNQQNKKAQG
jgi:predicted metal-dependent hydrolase